ncbi:hypothetical protein F4776DRAFT_662498 [Hypoxylon sp. NC0597]|nr:hypothetical protein F4776DRAFT_662498 [Hypoxylon sp. NC0597]
MSSMKRRVPKRWTEEEDKVLHDETQKQYYWPDAAAVGKIVKDWNRIAAKLPGRTNKDCRKRWVNKVCGSLKKGAWNEDEDERLLSGIVKHGQKWALVANQVGFRSPDQCAKRWQSNIDPNLERGGWSAEEVKPTGTAFLFEASNPGSCGASVEPSCSEVDEDAENSLDSKVPDRIGAEKATRSESPHDQEMTEKWLDMLDDPSVWMDQSGQSTGDVSTLEGIHLGAKGDKNQMDICNIHQGTSNDMNYFFVDNLMPSGGYVWDRMVSNADKMLLGTDNPGHMGSVSRVNILEHSKEDIRNGQGGAEINIESKTVDRVGRVSLVIDECDQDTFHHLFSLTRSCGGNMKIEIDGRR